MTRQASSEVATILAANVRRVRHDLDLTQVQMASRLGIDSALLSKWERGWHRPSNENMIRLAELSGHSLAWFYADHGPSVSVSGDEPGGRRAA